MSEKNMGRLAQDMKRELIAIISRLKDPRLAGGHVRTEISRKMHIRKAPRFVFVEDDGAAYAAHINELLKELHVEGGDAEAPADAE